MTTTQPHPYDAVIFTPDYEAVVEPVLLAALDLSILVNEEFHRLAALEPHPVTSAYYTELSLMRTELRENVRRLVEIGQTPRGRGNTVLISK